MDDYLRQTGEHIIATTTCSSGHFKVMPYITYTISCTNTGSLICYHDSGGYDMCTITDDDTDARIDSLYRLVCKSILLTRDGIILNLYDVIIVKKSKILTENDTEKIKELFETDQIQGISLSRFNQISDVLKRLPKT